MDTKDPFPANAVALVDQVICTRRTLRVESEEPASYSDGLSREVIEEMLTVAGYAPFHHEAPSGAPEPWRCHVFDAKGCRWLRERALDAGVGGRIPGLLAAASSLILVTWTPEGEASPVPGLGFEVSLKNVEHIAAASAMIQNLLLAATVRNVHTYWSSGGWLSWPSGMETAGVPEGELLLGAVFVAPASLEGVTTSPGKKHAKRTEMSRWTRWADPV